MKKIWIMMLLSLLLMSCQPAPAGLTPQGPLQTVEKPPSQSPEDLEKARQEALEIAKKAAQEHPTNQNPTKPGSSVGTPSSNTAVNLDRPYAWYVDQGSTGTYAGENCGPSSAVMALKWFDKSASVTAEEARSQYRPQGGWWFTDDIFRFLTHNDVPVSYRDFERINDLTQLLDSQRIVILCIDTTYLSASKDHDSDIGRFYDFQGGHFLVAKGYRTIDGVLYIETYDPMSWGMKRTNGVLSGIDRLYPANELSQAIIRWWPSMIVIGK